VFQTKGPNLVPLYRYYNPTTGYHFYTQSITEGNAAVSSDGYSYEGIAAYIMH